MNFIINLNGQSADNLVQFNIQNNTGTMVTEGETYNTIAYYTQVMGLPPDYEVRWIDLLGVSEKGDNLAIVYIGCEPPPDTHSVTSVWEEDFANTLQADSPEENTPCDFTDLSNKPDFVFQVDLPALNGLPQTALSTGIQINGKLVYLQDNAGWFVSKGINYTLIPISTVDCEGCGANCDTCLQSPWYEIHFIYYTEQPQPETGFGIFYIYPYNQTFVQLNYTFTLPTMEQPAITYNAPWSGSLNVVHPGNLPVVHGAEKKKKRISVYKFT
jgi:hypothetical protein